MQHYKPPGAVKKQENPLAPGPGGKDPNANSEDQKAAGGGGGGGGDKSRRNRNKNKQQQNGNKGEGAGAGAGGDVDKLAERVGSLNVDEAAASADKGGQQRGNNKRGKKPEQGRFIRRASVDRCRI